MGDYTGTEWDEDSPAGSDSISSGDTEITEFKAQVGELLDKQHRLLRNSGISEGSGDTKAMNGKHRLGGTAVLYTGTTANIISGNYAVDGDDNNVEGAMAYDTTRQCLVSYDGSAWIPITDRVAFAETDTPATAINSSSWIDIGSDIVIASCIADEVILVSTMIHMSPPASAGTHKLRLYDTVNAVAVDITQFYYEGSPNASGGTSSQFYRWKFPAVDTSYTLKLQGAYHSTSSSRTVDYFNTEAIVRPYGIT